ncbi:MAG: crossover junction endodeoxyribonuclease [Proteobacteria bacterium]|nr:crossover junction endodeoxyribonuclease [Pseudomonadota bacterium]
MNLVGIDPGISGAISILREGNISMVVDMPTMTEGTKSKKQINAAELANILTKENISHDDRVILENVSAMPGQGVTGMFSFGQSFGVIKGVCAALKLPVILVRPVKWKKHFNLLNSEKDASRTKVIETYPYISSELSKKKDANKADAILIAKYYFETLGK